jgi:hypothetical protein
MAASYPTSIAAIATVNNGDVSDASQINVPSAEVVAVETGLLNGFQHDLKPDTDDTRSLGSTAKRWLKAWLQDLDIDGTFTLNGSVFAFANNGAVQGRLTLTTLTPVTTADVTAATNLYFTPYGGKYIALFDGVATWTTYAFTELSIAIPATVSQLYDVFVYNNAGTPTLELFAWASDTTRATALILQDGVLVKSGATTRRFVGCVRTTTVSGQTEDSAAKRYVWNYYNRLPRAVQRKESTTVWTYTTATWRQANASAANQVDLVVGVAESLLVLHLQVTASSDSGGGSGVHLNLGIGEDSTTTPIASAIGYLNIFTPVTTDSTVAILIKVPPLGRHIYTWLEASEAVGTTTWYGANNSVAGATTASGLQGMWSG